MEKGVFCENERQQRSENVRKVKMCFMQFVLSKIGKGIYWN
jgi:hypothetical protein